MFGNSWFKKERPLFTGLHFGFGGGGAGGVSKTPFTATGGTKATPGDGYVYHTFDSPSPTNEAFIVGTAGADMASTPVTVVMVGGGGNGGGAPYGTSGNNSGGGGGGGGAGVMITSSNAFNTGGSYPVSVGDAGSANAWNASTPPAAADGGDSRVYQTGSPTVYVQGAGGEAGRNGPGGQGNSSGGEGGSSNAGPWHPSFSDDARNAGQDGSNGGYDGGGGGYSVLGPNPSWWRPYVNPGEGGSGSGFTSNNAAPGQTYGGGGGGGPGSWDGGPVPSTHTGDPGAKGRIIIRYPAG